MTQPVVNAGDRLYVSQHNRITGFYIYLGVDEETLMLNLETDDDVQESVSILIENIKMLENIDTAGRRSPLPKTKDAKQIPVEQRLKYVQKLFKPGGELDLRIHKVLEQCYGKEMKLDALNAKEQRIVQYRLNQMWKIVEDAASYLILVGNGNRGGIQSERTQRRINEKRANFPSQENNSTSDFMANPNIKNDYLATSQLYKQGKYNDNQYANADFNMDMDSIMNEPEKQVIHLIGHGNSQEETADSMNLTRDKVRTLRKRIAHKYEADKAGQSVIVKPDQDNTAIPDVMKPSRRVIEKGWVCAVRFFETVY